ncbi:cell division site-positioning protein MapZ family protein [Streptococcus iniae]|nr:cell division site-positioning protein MapZ family protein [Streptococcus iniae]
MPYNNVAIADSGNPAWLINPGVLERIIATSQARGYFTGSNYIIEPVNIINGNGYYNMFKTDGTYLFSINGKTGYFVGNAKGNADALDY